MFVIYTDRVIQEIECRIAAFRPEKGGALLGIPNTNLVTHFIEDSLAQTTSASYYPSQDLSLRVQEMEKKGLIFKGIVHSHPNGYDRPSLTDLDAFRMGLDINPRMPSFIAPIVTVNNKKNIESHEISFNSRGQISTYVAYRTKIDFNSRGYYNQKKSKYDVVDLEIANCSIVPIEAHITELLNFLEKNNLFFLERSNGYFTIGAVTFISERCVFEIFELLLLFPPDYPLTKPFLLITVNTEDEPVTKEISFSWYAFYQGTTQLADLCGNEILKYI